MNESKYYNYGIKNFLSKEINEIKTSNQYISIHLCVYSVNTQGVLPFLQYLLTNNGYNLLTFPKLPIYTLINKQSLIPYSEVYLSGILQSSFDEFTRNVKYDGFYEYDDDLYLFFDVTNCDINIDETYFSNHVRFGIMDEIVNHKNICNIQIDYNTTNFFIKNESLMYLFDEKNESYELPIIGFVGKSTEQKAHFVHMFRESAKDKTAILGPYFYFTSFHNAIRHGGWSADYKEERSYDNIITDHSGKYKKGGLVRFALFIGKAKYIENLPNDPNDESEIKKNRLNDNMLDSKTEMLTLRISDHDGIWAKQYDSIYLGKLELDDGSIIKDAPYVVLKEYNQQIPLSFHFIDKNTLGDCYEEKNFNYSIA
jgi:hypothetical protein